MSRSPVGGDDGPSSVEDGIIVAQPALIGEWPSGKAADSGSANRRFESSLPSPADREVYRSALRTRYVGVAALEIGLEDGAVRLPLVEAGLEGPIPIVDC